MPAIPVTGTVNKVLNPIGEDAVTDTKAKLLMAAAMLSITSISTALIQSRVGLFGYNTETESEIKQVAVVHSYIVGDTSCRWNNWNRYQGTVRASAVSGSISGKQNVGGLFGDQD